MKILSSLIVCSLMTGCASLPSDHASMPRDPSQWRVVSITPVPAGTAAQVAAKSPDGNPVEYSSSPVHFYNPAPVFTPAPDYTPYPVYAEPTVYWPPVTLSLGFVFGHRWGGGHFRHRGHR